jgi:predicted transcriptional regulator
MAHPCFGDQGGATGANQVLEVDLESLFEAEPEDGFTVRELCRRTGKTANQVRHRLRRMIKVGKVEFAGRRLEQNIMDDGHCNVPVYRSVREGA